MVVNKLQEKEVVFFIKDDDLKSYYDCFIELSIKFKNLCIECDEVVEKVEIEGYKVKVLQDKILDLE